MLTAKEFEDWRKRIAQWWSKPRTRLWLVIIAIALSCYLFGKDYLPYRRENEQLRHANAEHLKTIAEKDGTVSTLRHENENLLSINNRLQIMLNPIERKAKEIYPELESAAAVAKLAANLEEIRNLATRTTFKPLSSDLKGRLFDSLTRVQKTHPTNAITFEVHYLSGSNARSSVAKEFTDILGESGFSA
jgi:hypothetical protein